MYDTVSLATARDKTTKARKQLVDGVDPCELRKSGKQAEIATVTDSFEAVAREWHAKFSPDWSVTHGNKLIRRLEMHAFPFVGGKAISNISAADVLALLQKPECRGELETEHGVRVVVGQVCRYTVANCRASGDPTPTLRGAIKPHRNKHMASVTSAPEVGLLMRAIDQNNGGPIVRTALILSALTFQRPGDVRMMEWSEVDLVAGMCTIPSAEMKRVKEDKENGLPHLVPLASQAVRALTKLAPLLVTVVSCFRANDPTTVLSAKTQLTWRSDQWVTRRIKLQPTGSRQPHEPSSTRF